jgi:hypothetical protein
MGWQVVEPALQGSDYVVRHHLLDRELSPKQKDDLLLALVRCARSDAEAALCLTACLYPGLSRIVHRYCDILDGDEAWSGLVEALIRRLRTFNPDRCDRFVAANLLRALAHELRRLALSERTWVVTRGNPRTWCRRGDFDTGFSGSNPIQPGFSNPRRLPRGDRPSADGHVELLSSPPKVPPRTDANAPSAAAIHLQTIASWSIADVCAPSLRSGDARSPCRAPALEDACGRDVPRRQPRRGVSRGAASADQLVASTKPYRCCAACAETPSSLPIRDHDRPARRAAATASAT